MKHIKLFEGLKSKKTNVSKLIEDIWSMSNKIHLLMDEGYLNSGDGLKKDVNIKDVNDFLKDNGFGPYRDLQAMTAEYINFLSTCKNLLDVERKKESIILTEI